MESIKLTLTEFGEKLVGFGANEEKKLSLVSPIGCHIHDELSEYPTSYLVHLISVSPTRNVIYCLGCERITSIPREVDTYAKLRLWCALEIESARIHKERVGTIPIEVRSGERAELEAGIDDIDLDKEPDPCFYKGHSSKREKP